VTNHAKFEENRDLPAQSSCWWIQNAALVPMGGVIGRDPERQALRAVLDAARNCMSGTLILRGEAGGSLLDDVVLAAPYPHVLDIDGVESEVSLGLAALHERYTRSSTIRRRCPNPKMSSSCTTCCVALLPF
jgi:hypothetical protein